MSLKLIRRALDTRLLTLPGIPPVAWENTPYEPTIGTLYLATSLLPAQSRNDTMVGEGGQDLTTEQGIYQITVVGPSQEGPGSAATVVEAIRGIFQRGLSLTAGGVVVKIAEKPSVGPAFVDSDWYSVPVSVSYFSHVFE